MVSADPWPLPQAASEWLTLEHKVRLARFYRAANPAFSEWSKARKIGVTGRVAGREQFFEDVGRAVRQPRGEYTADPHINRVANMIRDGREGYLRIIRNLDEFTDVTKARIFAPDQSETLGRILRKEVPGITDKEVEDIIRKAAPRPPEKGVSRRARRRLGLDESHKIDVTDADGNLTSLAINDLLENNAETLMHIYSRQVLGHSAMAEVFRGMSRSPDDVIDSFDTLISRLRDEGRTGSPSARDLRPGLRETPSWPRS